MRDYAERKNLSLSAANFEMDTRNIRRGDPMWSPGNVTFHTMRDYAERKNLSLSAADFEMDTRTSVGATLCGRPET